MNIFHITQTKYRCVRVRFSGGISFTFPPGGSPRWRQTMTHHRLGGAAFLAIISSSFSLFRNLPTMCRIMSNSDKCLLLNDVKKYQEKKSQLRYLCQFALFTELISVMRNCVHKSEFRDKIRQDVEVLVSQLYKLFVVDRHKGIYMMPRPLFRNGVGFNE